MKKTQIIIESSGGCICSIYSSDPRVQIELLDWDNATDEGATSIDRDKARALETKAKQLNLVF